jgi:hypothetical protein
MEFHSINEEIMENHLKDCMVNPQNKACIMCDHVCKRNDIEGGMTLKWYQCRKPNDFKALEEVDMMLMGAECFEEREEKQIPEMSSDEYIKHINGIAGKVTKKITN